jgi:Nicotinamide mononucleotide transporter.
MFICFVIEVVGVAILYYVFKNTQDAAPFLDSLITVSSIVAELMLCWKLYESWLVVQNKTNYIIK